MPDYAEVLAPRLSPDHLGTFIAEPLVYLWRLEVITRPAAAHVPVCRVAAYTRSASAPVRTRAEVGWLALTGLRDSAWHLRQGLVLCDEHRAVRNTGTIGQSPRPQASTG